MVVRSSSSPVMTANVNPSPVVSEYPFCISLVAKISFVSENMCGICGIVGSGAIKPPVPSLVSVRRRGVG